MALSRRQWLREVCLQHDTITRLALAQVFHRIIDLAHGKVLDLRMYRVARGKLQHGVDGATRAGGRA